MSHPVNLNWQVRLDRRLMGTHGGVRHLVVDVKAPPVAPQGARSPLNLGLVIDASGSMSGGPLEAAKMAAQSVVDRLTSGDRLTLVSFAQEVIVHADAVVTDEAGRRLLRRAIDGLQTRGSTDLGAGWLAGCRCVAGAMVPGGRSDLAAGAPAVQNRVILLSDGHANCGITDPAELGRHAAELRRRGLSSSTVGIGDGYSPLQLEAIAEHGGGRAHDAPCGEDIVAVVAGELGEILAMAAEDINLTVSVPNGVGTEVLGRYAVQRIGQELRIAVGSLVAGGTRKIVVQLLVPPAQAEDGVVLGVTSDWRERDSGRRVVGPQLVATLLTASEEAVAAEQYDRDLGRDVARMWQQHLELGSTLLNSEGDCEGAGRYVDRALVNYTSYCRSLPGTRDLVRELHAHRDRTLVVMSAGQVLNHVSSTKHFLKGNADFRINKRRTSRP